MCASSWGFSSFSSVSKGRCRGFPEDKFLWVVCRTETQWNREPIQSNQELLKFFKLPRSSLLLVQ